MKFHFTNIDIRHNQYGPWVGTGSQDVVSAIKAAILFLKEKPVPSPFKFADKREAIILLSHWVGDLHQPLHVGVVYLDEDGENLPLDNGGGGVIAVENDNIGGNLLKGVGGALHSQWDHTNVTLDSEEVMSALVARAATTGTTEGDILGWPEAWATDTLLQAHDAFDGIEFKPRVRDNWEVIFTDRPSYVKNMGKLQQRQIAKGGARLAQLLKAIFNQ